MIRALFALLLLCGPLLADPPKPAPWVTFPEVAPAPTPEPTPAPPAPLPGVQKLTKDEIYVIDSASDCFVLASPAGLVGVAADSGPLRVRGRFVGGSGKVETKTFKGPFVFTLDAIGTGRVEIFVVKAGAKGPEDVVRRLLDADDGSAPRPPPAPDDPLLAPVQAAYAAADASTRAADKAMLAEVYRATADSINGLTTVGQFYTVLKGATDAKISGRLKPIRLILDAELAKMIPDDPTKGIDLTTPLAEYKARLIALLNRMATVLEAIK